MKIEFTKMHGAGNDYIYVNTLKYPLVQPEAFAKEWSKPHTGIGSDGLVLIGPSEKGDFSMRIFNADGSEAMMCGNASRCVGKYLYEYGLTDKKEIALETLSGIKTLYLHLQDENVDSVTVDMGTPRDIHTVDLGNGYLFREGTAVNMGNPHLVIFTHDVSAIDLPSEGRPWNITRCSRTASTWNSPRFYPTGISGCVYGNEAPVLHRPVEQERAPR